MILKQPPRVRRLLLFLYGLFAILDDDAFVAFSGGSAVEAVGFAACCV